MNEIFILGIFSFIMGFVNSIAGGGGVFGVPAMLAIGLPPVNALTLNRISDIGNIVGSLRNYKKVDGFDARLAYLAVPPILIGAFVGANFITGLSEETLNQIVLGAVCVGKGTNRRSGGLYSYGRSDAQLRDSQAKNCDLYGSEPGRGRTPRPTF